MRFCVCVRNFHTIIIYPIRAIPFHTFLLYDLSLIVVSELKTILRSQESTFLFINDLSRHPTISTSSFVIFTGLAAFNVNTLVIAKRTAIMALVSIVVFIMSYFNVYNSCLFVSLFIRRK